MFVNIVHVVAFVLLYAWNQNNGLESTLLLSSETEQVDPQPMLVNQTLVGFQLNGSYSEGIKTNISPAGPNDSGGFSSRVTDGDTSKFDSQSEGQEKAMVPNDLPLEADSKKNQSINTTSSSIPAALRPVTFRGCCPENVANPFIKVCLTKEACTEGSLYPFFTRNESIVLKKYVPTGKRLKRLRRKCHKANAQLQPDVTWCSNAITTRTFPMGCSHLSMAGNSGPYDRALLFPTNKLLFCGIPKAGITQWLQFLRFTLGAKDYQSNPYLKYDARLFYFDKVHPKHQGNIWKNYKKAILLREPAERLLSAYLDKVALKRHDAQPHNDTKSRRNKVFGDNISFAEFVDYLSMTNVTRVDNTYRGWTGLSWRSDPHWRPQAWSCGLSENVQDFDYIGTLDNAAFHTKQILQKVGLWESHGRHYRTSKQQRVRGSLANTWPPPPLKRNETAVGFQQEGTNTNDQHNRNSRAKLDAYYTPDILKKVKEIYWMDFALWDAVKQAERKGHVSGRQIGKILNPEQCT
jgi:hypothetical protein